MKAADFKTQLQSLRAADFAIYDEEIDQIFLMLTKQARVSATAVVSIEEFVAEVYKGVKAVVIHMMQSQLKKSRKFLADLVAQRDINRDGYLEYQEFEDMLLEDLQVSFHPKLYETIILAQMLDPQKRHGKIKNELIKVYLGEGSSQQSMVVDMVPSQEKRGANRGAGAAAGKGGAAKPNAQSAAEAKMMQNVARKVLMGFQGALGDTLNKEDVAGDGLLPIDTISSIITAK